MLVSATKLQSAIASLEKEAESAKEVLTYNSTLNGNQCQGIVTDSDGVTLLVSSYTIGDRKMRVVDLRTGTNKEHDASFATNIDGIVKDMQLLGYLTADQTLKAGTSRNLAEDATDEYEDEDEDEFVDDTWGY